MITRGLRKKKQGKSSKMRKTNRLNSTGKSSATSNETRERGGSFLENLFNMNKEKKPIRKKYTIDDIEEVPEKDEDNFEQANAFEEEDYQIGFMNTLRATGIDLPPKVENGERRYSFLSNNSDDSHKLKAKKRVFTKNSKFEKDSDFDQSVLDDVNSVESSRNPVSSTNSNFYNKAPSAKVSESLETKLNNGIPETSKAKTKKHSFVSVDLNQDPREQLDL